MEPGVTGCLNRLAKKGVAVSEHVLVADNDGVRLITISRPEKKNALTQVMYGALIEALEQGDADPRVRVFVITSQGTIFTSGNDLSDFAAATARAEGIQSPAERFPFTLTETKKPILVAVNGPAVGVGVTMLLQCDLAYASEAATFRTPFVDLGLVPEGASSLLMPAALGRARANTLLLLGEAWTAKQALEAGLLAGVLPPSELLESVMSRARVLAKKAPGAVRATKALLGADNPNVLDRIRRANAVFTERIASPEFAEAAAAFMARRTPDFSNFS
jgi:enoyl-CoA hydratase/carnithine racemase